MSIKEISKFIGGILISIFGAVIIGGGILDMTEEFPDSSLSGDLAMVILFGILPFALGILLSVKTRKGYLESLNQKIECEVLKIASESGGELTAGELAVKTNMPIEKVQRVLDKFVDRGIVAVKRVQDRPVMFEFPEIKDTKKKESL